MLTFSIDIKNEVNLDSIEEDLSHPIINFCKTKESSSPADFTKINLQTIL